jgi:hypothetical protein
MLRVEVYQIWIIKYVPCDTKWWKNIYNITS